MWSLDKNSLQMENSDFESSEYRSKIKLSYNIKNKMKVYGINIVIQL